MPLCRHLRTTLLLSTSLALTSLDLIICVAPVLPTPDRGINVRLGLVLALACEVALYSALLVAEVVRFRRQSRTDFSDVGDSEAHSGSSTSSFEGAGASSTTVGNVAATARWQGVDLIEQTPSSRAERGSSESNTTTAAVSSGEVKKAKGAGKFLDASTQTEEEFWKDLKRC